MGLAFLLCVSPANALNGIPEQDTYGLGMGSAVAAIAGGTHAIQWNPAGIARATVPMAQLGLGFDPSSSDAQFNTSVLYPFQDGTVFALSQYSDFPNAPGATTVYTGSFAFPLNSARDFLLGFNLKYLTLSTSLGSAMVNGRGFGLDFGLSYDLRTSKGTLASFALAIKDVDTQIRFDNTGEQSLTRTFVLGAAYQDIPDARIEMDMDIVDQTLQNSTAHSRLRFGVEKFFSDRIYSVRAGYDDLFNNDGYFTMGAGYHPAQPFEISYAFRFSTTNSQLSHSLSFIYRFDNLFKNENNAEKATPSASSPEINISNLAELTDNQAATGKPVSSIPLRKMMLQIEPAVFSPSGKQKTTSISFPNDNSNEIARWLIEIQSPNQKAIRRVGGTGPLLPQISWDGLTDEGKRAGEGKYRVVLKTFNKKNEILSNDSEIVELISPRSHFEIQTASGYFSTHAGKKRKNEITFTVQAGGSSDVQTWDFEISDVSNNKVVYESQGKNKLPKTIKWNGKNLNNEPAPDGNYLCLLIAQDRAGNSLKTDALQIGINNTPPDLTLKGDDNWTNFNSRKEFHFLLQAADRVGFDSWKTDLLTESGQFLKTFAGSGQPPKQITWDGTVDQGKPVEPGSLVKAVFSATDKAGNTTVAEPFLLQLDVKSTGSNEQMTLNLTSVTFQNMSSELDVNAKKEIEKSAASIRPYLNKSTLIVKGYASTDETGNPILLSRQRAVEVKKLLANVLGVPADGILAVGYSTKNALPSSAANPISASNQRRAIITLSTQP